VPLPLIEASSFWKHNRRTAPLLANGLWTGLKGLMYSPSQSFYWEESLPSLKTLITKKLQCFYDCYSPASSRKTLLQKVPLLHQSFSRENIIAISLVLELRLARVLFIPECGIFKRTLVAVRSEFPGFSFLRAVVGIFFILLVLGVMKMLSRFPKISTSRK
jgi:phosphatidylglycerol lysyltransferase